MLRWAFIFLLVGLVAALFGFTDVAGVSFEVARILFALFIGVFLILLVLALTIFRAAGG